MDPIVIFIATTAGALVGTLTGILLLRRKLRAPITETALTELKGKLQTGEASLAAASAEVKQLRAQLALQDTALLQSCADLERRQAQFEVESAETQREKVRRTAAEQNVQELGSKVVLLTEQCTKLEAQAKQGSDFVVEMGNRLVSVEGELEAARKRIQELTDQAADLTSESSELKNFREQADRIRTDLETQLSAEREKVSQLSARIAELQSERSQLEVKVNEERGSAAKGIELLLIAQEKLSSAFKVLGSEVQNGRQSQALEAAVANGHQSQALEAAVANGHQSQALEAVAADTQD